MVHITRLSTQGKRRKEREERLMRTCINDCGRNRERREERNFDRHPFSLITEMGRVMQIKVWYCLVHKRKRKREKSERAWKNLYWWPARNKEKRRGKIQLAGFAKRKMESNAGTEIHGVIKRKKNEKERKIKCVTIYSDRWKGHGKGEKRRKNTL